MGKKCFVMSLLFYHYEHIKLKNHTAHGNHQDILKSLSGLATAKRA